MSKVISKGDSMVSKVLGIFFAIRPSRIEEELGSLESTKDTLREQERLYNKEGGETPGEVVESFHRRLLLSSGMSRTSKLPRDLVLFSATITAHEIAELSCSVSTGGGILGELVDIIESLGDDERINGLNEEVIRSDDLLDQIHDSVFLEVLSRYGMSRYAFIFENNRPLYEIRCEVGRRLLSPDLVDEGEHLRTLARFRRLFGPEFVQEFLGRLKKHDLLSY